MLSVEKRKLFKILEISAIFVGVIMALYSLYPVFASPPSSPYFPGETTDPTCLPTDPNCTVYPPLTTTLTTSTAITMGTSSLILAYNTNNYTSLSVGTDGALTVSSTNNATTTFANKISFLSTVFFINVSFANATSTNLNISGLANFSNVNISSVTTTNLSFSSESGTSITSTNGNFNNLTTSNFSTANISATSPATSYAWFVKALAASETGDADSMNRALEQSRITGPFEEWIAEDRVELAERWYGNLTPSARAGHDEDLALLVRSQRGIVAVG